MKGAGKQRQGQLTYFLKLRVLKDQCDESTQRGSACSLL